MAHKTVHAVIADVLRDADRPLTVREVYTIIVKKQLYHFRAKEPYNIVRNQLKRHCVENTHSCASKKKLFREAGTHDSDVVYAIFETQGTTEKFSGEE